MKIAGGCLCGAVRFEGEAEPMMAGKCYCADCRRSSGTGHCAHLVVPQTEMSVRGEPARFDRPSDSGNMVTRAFCGTCGSALFSLNASMPGMMFLRASALDDPEVFKPQMAVYASRAPSWDRPDASVPAFDLMPPTMPV